MTYYRLYSLDRKDTHITDVVHFNADGDAAAIAKVEADDSRVCRELWNRGRKVMNFSPRLRSDMRFEIYREPSNRFTNVIGSDGDWRWTLLDGRDQIVAYGVGHQSQTECQASIDAMRDLDSGTPVTELELN